MRRHDGEPDARNRTGRASANDERSFNSGIQPVRPLLLALFRRLIARRRLRKQFRAVRLACAGRLPAPADAGKLIFYLNHPSWWDPLLCIVLAPRFIPGRHFYAPIEKESLKRYGILRNFGLFPVEIDTPRGALQFLRAAETVLRRGDVLGLTPQGAFTDARVRPAGLKTGLGALMTRMERAGERVTAVPIAVEYTFWNERLPEALVSVGEPLHTRPNSGETRSALEWTATLNRQLELAQDELAAQSLLRSAQGFETLVQGRRGLAGFYGAWQRLRSLGAR